MTSPQKTTRSKVTYPLRTRIVVVVVLAVAVTGIVFAALATDTSTDGDGDGGITVSGTEPQAVPSTIANGVEAISPGRGTQALAQEGVTIDLTPGWAAELTLQPDSGAAIPIPEDEVETNALDQFAFQPGPDKVVAQLPRGNLCVRATIWDQVRGRPATERVESWCFDVT